MKIDFAALAAVDEVGRLVRTPIESLQMSYEGYTQKLCAAGHLREVDAYDWDAPVKCGCGEPFVWSHEVDQTNGDGAPYSLEFDKAALTEVCNMGHHHVVRECTYKIPGK